MVLVVVAVVAAHGGGGGGGAMTTIVRESSCCVETTEDFELFVPVTIYAVAELHVVVAAVVRRTMQSQMSAGVLGGAQDGTWPAFGSASMRRRRYLLLGGLPCRHAAKAETAAPQLDWMVGAWVTSRRMHRCCSQYHAHLAVEAKAALNL
jgi:hypothetical protein